VWFTDETFLSSRWRLHTGIELGGVFGSQRIQKNKLFKWVIEGTRTSVLDRTKKGHGQVTRGGEEGGKEWYRVLLLCPSSSVMVLFVLLIRLRPRDNVLVSARGNDICLEVAVERTFLNSIVINSFNGGSWFLVAMVAGSH
jgi:hypothetical protein